MPGRHDRIDALSGRDFTVSSLGSSGIDFFTPVVNPERRHPRDRSPP
jgi:pyruvate/2-oxoglutarate dehydrogenase complex dihydrolipoamide acyltransferase (E2) component